MPCQCKAAAEIGIGIGMGIEIEIKIGEFTATVIEIEVLIRVGSLLRFNETIFISSKSCTFSISLSADIHFVLGESTKI